MEFDFEKQMQQLTDAEIIKIISVDRSKYQEDALKAADNEFKKRKLPEELYTDLKRRFEAERGIEMIKADTPLNNGLKIVVFLVPGILNFIIGSHFRDDGYERKADELAKWTFLGFLFYVCIATLIGIFNK